MLGMKLGDGLEKLISGIAGYLKDNPNYLFRQAKVSSMEVPTQKIECPETVFTPFTFFTLFCYSLIQKIIINFFTPKSDA